jgi:hypothetical protein
MMRNTRRNLPKRGGKFLGEGTYGCGFSPPLKCKGEATRRNASKLTKMLISRKEADKEYQESRRILQLDPERSYFLTADGFCEHDQTNIRPNNQTKKCTKFPLKAESFLVFYEMGGDNLQDIKLPANKYWDFIRSFQLLLSGLDVLHKGGMVHLDIKPPNIVSKLTPRGTSYITRYIDFGLSEQIKNINEFSDIMFGTAHHLMKTFYPYYPLDSILASADFRSFVNPTAQKFVSEWYQYYGMYGNNAIPVDVLYKPEILDQGVVLDLPKIHGKDIIANFDAQRYSNTADFVKSIDVYSICVSLCQVYARITGHTVGFDANGQPTIKFQGGNFTLEELPDLGLNDESVRFHEQLAEFSTEFYDVMRLGLDFRCQNRKSAGEIADAFQALIARAENPFTHDDIAYMALVRIAPVLAPIKTKELLKHQEAKRTLVEFRPENLPKQTVAAPAVPTGLPPGWIEQKNNDGDTYYENPDLGHTQWAKPIPGWLQHYNEKSGDTYWENLKTGKTSWHLPKTNQTNQNKKVVQNPMAGVKKMFGEDAKVVVNPMQPQAVLRRTRRKPLAAVQAQPVQQVGQPNRAGRFQLNPAFGF